MVLLWQASSQEEARNTPPGGFDLPSVLLLVYARHQIPLLVPWKVTICRSLGVFRCFCPDRYLSIVQFMRKGILCREVPLGQEPKVQPHVVLNYSFENLIFIPDNCSQIYPSTSLPVPSSVEPFIGA